VARPHFSSQLLHNPLALLSFICNGDKRWIETSAFISDVRELGNGHGEVDPNRELRLKAATFSSCIFPIPKATVRLEGFNIRTIKRISSHNPLNKQLSLYGSPNHLS
jgi:hypothetical protein